MGFEFLTLQTGRLTLRPLEPEDRDFVFRHFSNPEVNRYLYDEPPVTRLDQAQDIVDFYTRGQHPSANRWVLEKKSDRLPLGTCGYHMWSRSHRRAEVGYDLDPEAWNQGYMTEAVSALLSHAFESLNLNRIEAACLPFNTPSRRLLLRCGFAEEGYARSYLKINGMWQDHLLFALLEDEI